MEPSRFADLNRRARDRLLTRTGKVARAEARPVLSRRDRLAVVRVEGVLVRSAPDWFSWLGVVATETPAIEEAVRAALEDDQVETILLHVDSPGGEAAGIADLADLLFEARSTKRVVSVVESLCASGAYWLASQAHELVAPKDAFLGSIGAYEVWEDSSRAARDEGLEVHVVRSGPQKGMGVMGAPISDEQLEAVQELVDGIAELFVAAVARGRGGEKRRIREAATGQLWLAGAAKARGLVDRIEPPARAFERLAQDPGPRSRPGTRTRALETEESFRARLRAWVRRRDRARARGHSIERPPVRPKHLVRKKATRPSHVVTAPTFTPPASAPEDQEEEIVTSFEIDTGRSLVKAARIHRKRYGGTLRAAMTAVATARARRRDLLCELGERKLLSAKDARVAFERRNG